MSVAVREEGGGKLGNATQWVEIPDLAQGKLTLSSLFLMKDDAPTQGRLSADGTLPGAAAGAGAPRLHSWESLYLQFFAYNLDRGG